MQCAGGSFLSGEKEVCLFVTWRNNEKLGAVFRAWNSMELREPFGIGQKR
jgi:hypothetical protein